MEITVKKLLLLGISSLFLMSSQLLGIDRCATPEPLPTQQTFYNQIVLTYRQSIGLQRFAQSEEIPVAFHIVRESSSGWNITDQQVIDQLNVLNEQNAYPGFNLTFILHSIHRTIEPNWNTVDLGSTEEINMKAALAVEPRRILNVYIVNDAGALGYAWFPDDFVENSTRHGVVVERATLPFNQNNQYGLGRTLTHEVGHYLGIFHTFQGDYLGCSSVDDSCDDTPAHLTNWGTPPITTDSCPNQPGFDPVHNFMNYVDDNWMTKFTDDQSELASAVSSDLRPNLFRNYIWKDYPWNTQNWRDVTWYEWINDGGYPWIYSHVHGWQWCDSDSISNVYMYDSALNWLWTNSSNYPWFFSYSLNAWIEYTLDSFPREFYNSATDQYFTVGQGQRTGI